MKTSHKFLFLFSLILGFSAFSSSVNAEMIIHRGNGAEPETLDMHKSTGVPEANIQRDLFEGLVSEAADGSLIPGAAESWKKTEDGKIWTFELRKNGKWSDGTQVTAADFVNGFQRALLPATASEYAFIRSLLGR